MINKYILSIDQSTSGTKAILVNQEGDNVYNFNTNHKQFYPQPGWVEHDAEEIYKKTLEAVAGVLEEGDISPQEIHGVAITNQRETVVVWDKDTGKPIYNAIVWQCTRSADICNNLKQEGFGEIIKDKTGLILSPYFSASKVKWILDNIEGAREKAESGRLLFGNMDSWLIWNLTGGRVHATDYSNASRTQLFNIFNLDWDPQLLDLFNIPASMLPKIKYSNEIFGYTDFEGITQSKKPISGVMGDSHAGLFGHNCFKKGLAKVTYGTGSSVMMNTGKQPIHSQNGLVTSIAWGAFDRVEYVLEGNVNFSADTIKWLVDDIELISDPVQSGELASSLRDNQGVYLIPAFAGLGAPYWDSDAKAAIIGMNRGTKKAHIVRAAEESIAYQIKDIIDLMVRESGIKLKELRVDGGATRDKFLMQFQADMLDVPICRNKVSALSALGAAFMAGLGLGFWGSIEDIEKLHKLDLTFNSNISEERREHFYQGWKEAINRIRTNAD